MSYTIKCGRCGRHDLGINPIICDCCRKMFCDPIIRGCRGSHEYIRHVNRDKYTVGSRLRYG